jgi:hypothetical protein
VSGPAEGWFPTELEDLNRSESESAGISESESESYSETEVPIFVPIPVQELGSETEWSREEKVSKVAEMLKCQQQRHCFIKLDTENTQPLKVPFVRNFGVSDEDLHEYEQMLYRTQGALPAAKVDRLINESERVFLLGLGESDPGLTTIDATTIDDSEFMEQQA